MVWIDVAILIFIFGVAVVQALRGSTGMGRPLFEMAGVVLAAFLATKWHKGISLLIGLKESYSLLLLFIIFSLFFLFLAYLLFNLIEWSLGALDSFFSFFFGIVLAWAISYVVLQFFYLNYGINSEVGHLLESSGVVREIVYFRTFKSILSFLHRVRLGPEITE